MTKKWVSIDLTLRDKYPIRVSSLFCAVYDFQLWSECKNDIDILYFCSGNWLLWCCEIMFRQFSLSRELSKRYGDSIRSWTAIFSALYDIQFWPYIKMLLLQINSNFCDNCISCFFKRFVFLRKYSKIGFLWYGSPIHWTCNQYRISVSLDDLKIRTERKIMEQHCFFFKYYSWYNFTYFVGVRQMVITSSYP